MPVDPRLNCAAEICCSPPPLFTDAEGRSIRLMNVPSHQARVAILLDLGVPDDLAHRVSIKMDEKGIVFLSAELATAIREIAFPAPVE